MTDSNFFQGLVEQATEITPVPVNPVTTVTLTVDKPKGVNLQTLATLTEAALHVLAPLCQQDKLNSSRLSEKALVYVGAIDSSINAAQYGYDVCEDVIRMAELIKDNAAENEVSEFATKILLQAQNAHERAMETLEKFRDFRVELQMLINETGSQEDKKPRTKDEPDRLKKSIRIFESLQESVDQYATWWSWINLATNSQVQNAIMYQVNHTSMRKKANLREWRNTKASFLEYSQKMQKVQHHHDKIFQLAAANSFSTATTVDLDFLHKQLALSRADELVESLSRDNATIDLFKWLGNNIKKISFRLDFTRKARKSPQMKQAVDQPAERSPIIDVAAGIGKRENPLPHISTPVKANKLPSVSVNLPLLNIENSMLVSMTEGTSGSHISANLAMVQVLPKGLCFLRLDIQSIGSFTHRVDSMTVKWHFEKPTQDGEVNERRPRAITIAPKQSSGARSQESRETNLNLRVPVQANFAGFTAGPEVGAQVNTQKKLERATVLTGFIGSRGQEVEWRVKENQSLKSGIPAHFCLAVVLEYSSAVVMKLEMNATQRTEKMLWDLSGPIIDADTQVVVDVDTLHKEYEPIQPAETWKDWFSKITGDVEGSNLAHSQVPFYKC